MFKYYLESIISEEIQLLQLNNMLGQLNVDKSLRSQYNLEAINYILTNLDRSTQSEKDKVVVQWLIKNIKPSLLSEDKETITEYLNVYFKNKHLINNKQLLSLTYSQLKEVIKPYLSGEEGDYHSFLKPQDLISSKNGITIYKITDVDTTMKVAADSGWCVQQEGYAKQYLSQGSLYFVLKNNKRYALLHFKSRSFMDVYDEPLKPEVVREIRNNWIGLNEIVNRYEDPITQVIWNPNVSKETQLKAVKENGNTIQYILNPDRELQLVAVKRYGSAIQYISNPDRELQLEAVKQSGYAIQFIENPDRELQLEAVKRYGSAIQFIENPDRELQLEAVKEDGLAIQYISNPDRELQLEAVKKDRKAIRYIKNPHPDVLKYIKGDN